MSKLKKKLKERANADHQKILRENQGFYDKLVAEHYPDESPKTSKLSFSWKKLSVVAASFIIIISSLLAVLIPQLNKDLNIVKEYHHSNFALRPADLTEVKGDILSFKINVESTDVNEITLTYDTVSGDKLYYKLTGTSEDGLEDWELFVDVNPYFALQYSEELYPQRETIHGHNIMYSVEREEADDLFIFENKAVIEFKNETVMITYHCLSFEDSGNTFLSWLGNFMK